MAESSTIRFRRPVTSLSISPSNTHIVLAARKGLHILALDNGGQPAPRARFLPHPSRWQVTESQWNPHVSHERLIASTSNQRCLIWDVSSGADAAPERCIWTTLDGHTRAISDLNWSPFHPDLIVTSSMDMYVFLWDLRSPARVPAMGFCSWTAGANQVSFSHLDENQLASAHDGRLCVWDLRRGSAPLAAAPHAHNGKINGLDWSHESPTQLVTCGQDARVKLWETNGAELRCAAAFPTRVPFFRARFTPAGGGLVCIPQHTELDLPLYNVAAVVDACARDAAPAPLHVFSGHLDTVRDFVWRRTPGGALQLVSWSLDQTLRLWDLPASIGAPPGALAGSHVVRVRARRPHISGPPAANPQNWPPALGDQDELTRVALDTRSSATSSFGFRERRRRRGAPESIAGPGAGSRDDAESSASASDDDDDSDALSVAGTDELYVSDAAVVPPLAAKPSPRLVSSTLLVQRRRGSSSSSSSSAMETPRDDALAVSNSRQSFPGASVDDASSTVPFPRLCSATWAAGVARLAIVASGGLASPAQSTRATPAPSPTAASVQQTPARSEALPSRDHSPMTPSSSTSSSLATTVTTHSAASSTASLIPVDVARTPPPAGTPPPAQPLRHGPWADYMHGMPRTLARWPAFRSAVRRFAALPGAGSSPRHAARRAAQVRLLEVGGSAGGCTAEMALGLMTDGAPPRDLARSNAAAAAALGRPDLADVWAVAAALLDDSALKTADAQDPALAHWILGRALANLAALGDVQPLALLCAVLAGSPQSAHPFPYAKGAPPVKPPLASDEETPSPRLSRFLPPALPVLVSEIGTTHVLHGAFFQTVLAPGGATGSPHHHRRLGSQSRRSGDASDAPPPLNGPRRKSLTGLLQPAAAAPGGSPAAAVTFPVTYGIDVALLDRADWPFEQPLLSLTATKTPPPPASLSKAYDGAVLAYADWLAASGLRVQLTELCKRLDPAWTRDQRAGAWVRAGPAAEKAGWSSTTAAQVWPAVRCLTCATPLQPRWDCAAHCAFSGGALAYACPTCDRLARTDALIDAELAETAAPSPVQPPAQLSFPRRAQLYALRVQQLQQRLLVAAEFNQVPWDCAVPWASLVDLGGSDAEPLLFPAIVPEGEVSLADTRSYSTSSLATSESSEGSDGSDEGAASGGAPAQLVRLLSDAPRAQRRGPLCSVCVTPVAGLMRLCLGCGHGGHADELEAWFDAAGGVCADGSCGCCCTRRDFGRS